MDKPRHIIMSAEPGHFGANAPNVQKTRLPLNCGRCNNRTFAAVVEPEGNMARVIGLECTACGNGWFVNDAGYLQTTGEITINHGDKGNGSVQ